MVASDLQRLIQMHQHSAVRLDGGGRAAMRLIEPERPPPYPWIHFETYFLPSFLTTPIEIQ